MEAIHPNVARLWGSKETFEQRALAAAWGAGDDAMTSHRTSASLWNVPRPEIDPIDLILPARARAAHLEGVVVTKVASPASVRRTMIRHAKRGRRGVTPLRNALERWLGDELPPDSALESKMAELIGRHRLPAVTFHAVVMGYEVDFRVDGSNIVLECDGWGTHGLDRDQFEFDRARDGELTAAGYVVVHFTWRMLTTDPDAVATRLVDNVRTWAPHLLKR